MTVRASMAVAAIGVALSGAGAVASPVPAAQARSLKGMRIYNCKKPYRTSKVRSYGKVQMCLNAKGDHVVAQVWIYNP
jgi:hypothetical protein